MQALDTTAVRHRPSYLWTIIRTMQGDAIARRARRVMFIVLALWVMNLCDLWFTLHAVDLGGFHEANPVARHFLHSAGALVCYKLTLVAISSVIILAFRRHALTELGCWGLLTVYSALVVIWWAYYSYEPVAIAYLP
jgi:hypothetical protein